MGGAGTTEFPSKSTPQGVTIYFFIYLTTKYSSAIKFLNENGITWDDTNVKLNMVVKTFLQAVKLSMAQERGSIDSAGGHSNKRQKAEEVKEYVSLPLWL